MEDDQTCMSRAKDDCYSSGATPALERLGSARTAKLLCVFVVEVAKVANLLSVRENCGFEAKERLGKS
jgi:hypothetical protein